MCITCLIALKKSSLESSIPVSALFLLEDSFRETPYNNNNNNN